MGHKYDSVLEIEYGIFGWNGKSRFGEGPSGIAVSTYGGEWNLYAPKKIPMLSKPIQTEISRTDDVVARFFGCP